MQGEVQLYAETGTTLFRHFSQCEERRYLNTSSGLAIHHPLLAAAWSSRGAPPNMPSEILSPNSLFGTLLGCDHH
jgi:hypothetical protein